MAKKGWKKVGSSNTTSISPNTITSSTTNFSKRGRERSRRTVTRVINSSTGEVQEFTSETFSDSPASRRSIGSILNYVFVFLILTLLIRVLSFVSSGADLSDFENVPTFTGLLELLSTVEPPFQIPFLLFKSSSLGDWGALNFIRNFIALFVKLVDVLVFIANGLAVLASYLSVLVQWLFL